MSTEGKIANPSKPSVKFTAFDEPTRTNIPVEINTNALIGIIKSLKNGTMNDFSAITSAE